VCPASLLLPLSAAEARHACCDYGCWMITRVMRDDHMGSGKRMLVKGCYSVQEEHHWDGMPSVVTVSVLAVLTCLGQPNQTT
jgi:hypothetical protein